MIPETHDKLQSYCFLWLWNTHSQTRHCCFAALNELPPYPGESKKQYAIRISKAKATGLVPGVFDLLFYWKGVLYCFDIKVGKDKLSIAQEHFAFKITEQGGKCYTISNFNTFVEWVNQILKS